MIPSRHRFLARLLAAALCAAAAARGALWVSPGGDDTNPGTEERPLRTVARARDLVRTMNASMGDDITVFISGVHRLAGPVEFGPQDSGTNGFSVVYTAAPGEHPVLSGALRVTGWARVNAALNLWSAPAPEGVADTRDLYVDGLPARRTRARLVQALAGGPPAAPDAASRWRNPGDVAFLAPEPGALWSERGGAGPAFVENAFELLGRPGEWYLDRAARRIYYTPRAGEDLATADVEAAVAGSLLAGTGRADAPLNGLVFKGIRFAYTTWPAGGGSGSSGSQAQQPGGPQAAVRFAFAGSIQLLEDEFVHLATPALDLGPSLDGATVEGCLFGDIAWTAVRIPSASRVTVVQSRFSYVATRQPAGAALSLSRSRDVLVEHNQIDPTPGAPIFMDPDGPSTGSVALNRVSPSLTGSGDDAPGPQPADAGLSDPYRALLEVPLSPAAAPEPPTDVAAEAEEGFAYVTWDPPVHDGGSPVLAYMVAASSGATLSVPAKAFRARGYARFGGLDTRVAVSFTVAAVNARGPGVPSLATAAVVPAHKRRLRPPQAPAAAAFTPVAGGARIVLTPPAADGGSPVVAYAVTVLPAGPRILLEGRDVIRAAAPGALERTVAGLAPGAGATVAVAALNAKGEGPPAQALPRP